LLLATAASLAACSNAGEDPASGVRLPKGGPDPIVVRVPLTGGVVRAYRYPRLDSLAWRSAESAPALGALLSFDNENGTMAFVDAEGTPGWIDFRAGSVRQPPATPLALTASSEGFAVFGVTQEKRVVRLTPAGDWTRDMDRRVRKLFPLPDGVLLVLEEGEEKMSRLLRFRPPEDATVDSVTMHTPQRSVSTVVGDRIYLAIGSELVAVPTSDFSAPVRVNASDEILAIAPTPSGDRIYVAAKGEKSLDVVDRYSASITSRVRLGGFVTELRMDPVGRYLLARPVDGDSAWVVAIATGTLAGSVRTEWRSDLPFVAADGAIATLRGPDVDFVDPINRKLVVKAPGGAADLWHAVLWNGLRPRARGLDRAVMFQSEQSAALAGAADSATGSAVRDSVAAEPAALRTPNDRDAPTREPEAVRDPEPPRDRGWTVSFAALLAEDRARELAREIKVDGVGARVSVSRTDGTPIYRVVMGPYATRADAERIGRESRHSYFLIEGIP
jgi:cell division septation protein DedD